MARPYSADLRARVLLAHEHGEGGATALARRFRIGLSTVYRWLADLRDCQSAWNRGSPRFLVQFDGPGAVAEPTWNRTLSLIHSVLSCPATFCR